MRCQSVAKSCLPLRAFPASPPVAPVAHLVWCSPLALSSILASPQSHRASQQFARARLSLRAPNLPDQTRERHTHTYLHTEEASQVPAVGLPHLVVGEG